MYLYIHWVNSLLIFQIKLYPRHRIGNEGVFCTSAKYIRSFTTIIY